MTHAAQGETSPTADLKTAFWRGYTTDTTDEEARRLFQARFNRPPTTVVRAVGLVLAGPITDTEGRHDHETVLR